MSSKPKQREAELDFEGAMDRLEKIVEQMESGKLPLEDLIVRYEEGMNLVKICQERLANAEQKIEIIARNSAGKTVVKEFEAAPEPETPARVADESPSTNDEIRLFRKSSNLRGGSRAQASARWDPLAGGHQSAE